MGKEAGGEVGSGAGMEECPSGATLHQGRVLNSPGKRKTALKRGGGGEIRNITDLKEGRLRVLQGGGQFV